MLTVRELLGGIDVRVLCGEAGLDAAVRRVHVSELLDPTPWLWGGELLLTTGAQLGSARIQREFVARLRDKSLAGLGLGLSTDRAAAPPALLEAAAAGGFLVFEIPSSVPLTTITDAALVRLADVDPSLLQRVLDTQDALEQIVFSERGLDALIDTLTRALFATVLVMEGNGDPLIEGDTRAPLPASVLRTLRSELGARTRRGQTWALTLSHGDRGLQSMAYPIRVRRASGSIGADSSGPADAWLVAVKPRAEFTDFDRLTLDRAVTIVALELRRLVLAEESRRQRAGELLDAVVRRQLTGDKLVERLAPFGLAHGAGVVLVAAPSAAAAEAAHLATAVSAGLRREGATGLVAARGELAWALVPSLEDEDLFALGGRIGAGLTAELGIAVRVAVGRAGPATEIGRSLEEARAALDALAVAAVSRNGSGAAAAVATYRDLGSTQLLLSLQDPAALGRFCESVLGPVEAVDGRYGGELTHSLQVFIEENGQWERASRRLFCHRHTLRYRIKRIEELTGRDLETAEDRIEFWLALKGRELAAAREGDSTA